MTLEQFWKIVDKVHRASKGAMDAKCELLRKELRKLPAKEVRSFEEQFAECEARAYTWELWAAAYIIGGGCSDDMFMDFRATLISMGQSTFDRVVSSPATLASMDLNEDSAFYEGYQYVATDVYEDITSKEMPVHSKPHPKRPAGRAWKESEAANLYPELAKKRHFNG